MKINTTSPYTFATGELLDPTKANENLQALVDADAEACSRRYARSILPIRFMTDINNGYTESTTAEIRSFRFMFPKTVVIERAFFAYLGTGTNVVVDLLEIATGLAPAGVTNPYLTVASGATEATDIATEQVTLVANTHYRLKINSAGAFDATKAEVILHLLADRFQADTGADARIEPEPIYLSEQDTVDAATFLTHANSVIDDVDDNNSTLLAACYKPTLFTIEGLTSALALANRRWDVPRSSSQRRKAKISGVVIYIDLGASTGAALQTVTWKIETQLGVTIYSRTTSVAGLSGMVTDSEHDLAISMMASALTTKTLSASDYTISVSTNGATTIAKTYAYFLWE